MNTAISMRASVYASTHKFINLTTFRKNGQGISTPVTYAPYEGRLYVVTGVKSGKARRLKHNSRVEFALLMFFFNRLRDLRQGGNIYLEVTPGDLK